MGVNFLRTALRYLFKDRVVSLLNVAGLSLGMGGALLLLLNIWFEYSVDQFHTKKDRIYKVYYREMLNGRLECMEANDASLAPALQDRYPLISGSTRISPTERTLSHGDVQIKSTGFHTDPAFLNIFSFPLIEGRADLALNDLHSIVITRSLARKLFGSADPIYQTIGSGKESNFIVTGVLEDLPGNTDLRFEYLIPWNNYYHSNADSGKIQHNATSFMLLQPGVSAAILNRQLDNFSLPDTTNHSIIHVFLHPLTQDHLYYRFENGKPVGGAIEIVHILEALTFVILFISCINFINLSTARNKKRSKEVAIRKVMGAAKRMLLLYFIGESILLALIAGAISLLLVQIFLPFFCAAANVIRQIPYNSFSFWLMLISFILITGILAGIYPAYLLSSFQPVPVLKGRPKNKRWPFLSRNILVVVQFVVAVFFINFSIFYKKQLKYTEDRPLGYNTQHLFFTPLTTSLLKKYDVLKSKLLSSGTALQVCLSATPITRTPVTEMISFWKEGREMKLDIGVIGVSEGYVTTNGLHLLKGRDLNVFDFLSDTASCLINETALKLFGFEDPLGSMLDHRVIVGVVSDFLTQGPDQSLKPVMIVGSRGAAYLSMRLAREPIKARKILQKYDPGSIIELQSVEDDYKRNLSNSKSLSRLIIVFTVVSIFISCIGLFSISVNSAERRAKEVSIRKVLGAGVGKIALLMASQFVKLVMLSIVIATPLAILTTNLILRPVSYRTEFSWWIPVVAGLAALVIAIITIGSQSIKTALTNPIKYLRSE